MGRRPSGRRPIGARWYPELLHLADVRRLQPLRTAAHVELQRLALGKRLESVATDGREMHEYVLTAIRLGDEAEALRLVEPLHGATSHLKLLLYAGRSTRPLPRITLRPRPASMTVVSIDRGGPTNKKPPGRILWRNLNVDDSPTSNRTQRQYRRTRGRTRVNSWWGPGWSWGSRFRPSGRAQQRDHDKRSRRLDCGQPSALPARDLRRQVAETSGFVGVMHWAWVGSDGA